MYPNTTYLEDITLSHNCKKSSMELIGRALYQIAIDHNVKTVVEFSADCVSTISLTAAVSQIKGGKVYSFGNKSGNFASIKENISSAELNEFVEIIDSDFNTQQEMFVPRDIDLLYIQSVNEISNPLFNKVLNIIDVNCLIVGDEEVVNAISEVVVCKKN